MRRYLIFVAFGVGLLSGCASTVPREDEITVGTLTLSLLQKYPASIEATLTGWSGVCERLEVQQRLTGKTFELSVVGITEVSPETECPAVARYTEKTKIEFHRYNLEPTIYTVTAGLLEKTFSVPADDTYEASVDTVEVALLESEPVQVVATASGSLRSGCEAIGSILQRLRDKTFFVEVFVTAPWGEACTPIAPPFIEKVTLETDDLEPGLYEVNVNGVVKSFTLP